MKSIVYTQYGSPDVLEIMEVAKPNPKDDEILVKIHAASVNPYDWHYMRGKPYFMRLMGAGILKPKKPILGADIAGRVELVGSKVKQFKEGDEVFGDVGLGGFADYVCSPENRLAIKPKNLTFEEAAAVPMAALTALQGLRDEGQIQQGQKVLINGASGGVGTFAVQIAKSFGAEVTAVCSTANMEMLRLIGADYVIDYTQEDFTQNGQSYDLIIDTAAHRSLFGYKRALVKDGIYVLIGGSGFLQKMIQLAWISMIDNLPGKNSGKKFGMMMAKVNQADLVFLKELLETGKIKPIIDKRYTLSETSEAIRYLEEGHSKGKNIITI